MLESAIFSKLFPYTAKRQPMVAEESIDISAEEPVYGQAPAPLPDDVNAQLGIATPNGSVVAEQIDTPNVVDDRVAIEQALPAPAEVNNPPLVPLGGKRVIGNAPAIDLDRPEFELPYPQPTSMYEQTQNALAKGQYDVQNPVNRDKGFKGALKEALQNFAFGLSHAQPGMGFWESMALGGAGVGRGAVERSWNEQRKAQQELPMLQQNAKIASDEMDAVARRDNIKFDNELGAVRVDDARTARQERNRLGALNKIVGLKRFDPKDPTQAALVKQAGLDPESLKGWDDRNPVEKLVAGVQYRLNRATGAYEPTNLPVDEAKTITDYKVKMPNGEVRTYKVAQKDAANFATQFQALGLRLEQDESQFQRTLGQRQSEFLTNFQYKIAQDAQQFANDAVKRAQWKTEQITKIQSDSELPEEVRVQMIEAIGKLP